MIKIKWHDSADSGLSNAFRRYILVQTCSFNIKYLHAFYTGKNYFAEISKNLIEYRLEFNFVGLSK